ncbi:hypothetical protein BLNAU_19216 [Blattamonas nauphoetae]|uniref:Uncharacterized protein n=1 Tax=Blattamonas nauphoetae TaxID=2049346 RepID=A0ABQ9X256_9EUKA|nr:hypothetical protein BLNAU_19216 [Blattamonas nauphoetae]
MESPPPVDTNPTYFASTYSQGIAELIEQSPKLAVNEIERICDLSLARIDEFGSLLEQAIKPMNKEIILETVPALLETARELESTFAAIDRLDKVLSRISSSLDGLEKSVDAEETSRKSKRSVLSSFSSALKSRLKIDKPLQSPQSFVPFPNETVDEINLSRRVSHVSTLDHINDRFILHLSETLTPPNLPQMHPHPLSVEQSLSTKGDARNFQRYLLRSLMEREGEPSPFIQPCFSCLSIIRTKTLPEPFFTTIPSTALSDKDQTVFPRAYPLVTVRWDTIHKSHNPPLVEYDWTKDLNTRMESLIGSKRKADQPQRQPIPRQEEKRKETINTILFGESTVPAPLLHLFAPPASEQDDDWNECTVCLRLWHINPIEPESKLSLWIKGTHTNLVVDALLKESKTVNTQEMKNVSFVSEQTKSATAQKPSENTQSEPRTDTEKTNDDGAKEQAEESVTKTDPVVEPIEGSSAETSEKTDKGEDSKIETTTEQPPPASTEQPSEQSTTPLSTEAKPSPEPTFAADAEPGIILCESFICAKINLRDIINNSATPKESFSSDSIVTFTVVIRPPTQDTIRKHEQFIPLTPIAVHSLNEVTDKAQLSEEAKPSAEEQPSEESQKNTTLERKEEFSALYRTLCDSLFPLFSSNDFISVDIAKLVSIPSSPLVVQKSMPQLASLFSLFSLQETSLVNAEWSSDHLWSVMKQTIPSFLQCSFPSHVLSTHTCSVQLSKSATSPFFKSFFAYDLHRDATNGAIPLQSIKSDQPLFVTASPVSMSSVPSFIFPETHS